MPREAIRTSASLGGLLRARREALGLSLYQVADQTKRSGEAIPPSTISRIENGHTEPGVLRFHQLLRLYNLSPQYVAERLDLERLGIAEPPSAELPKLYDEALGLWKKGQVREAFARFIAVRERSSGDAGRALRHRASVALAVAAQNVGQLRFARDVLEETLLDSPDA